MSSSPNAPPYLMVKALGSFRSILLKLYRRLFPGSVVLYEQFQSFWLLQPLYIAAELDIAGYIKEGPLSVEDLAIKTNTQTESLYRVLRALASEGIFTELPGRKFKLNSTSRALLEGNGSMRNMIIHHLGTINWSASGNLMHTVKTGENAFKGLFGMNIYPFLQEHPENMQCFEKSMSELSELALYPVLSRYDFSKCRTVADIGGGVGLLLSKILEKYPSLQGRLFDLPENAGKAAEYIESCGLGGRMSFVPGSFLEPFSLEADVYLMKNVLHNWDDEQCIIILENLKVSMGINAKLLILEMVVPGPGIASYAKMVDVQMLTAMPGGKERTKEEFTRLLRKSGFKLTKLIPTVAPLSILETVPE
ncbi:MAG: methyltransferase [Bacteroidota bacterium]|jgi:O-methyltransferase domain